MKPKIVAAALMAMVGLCNGAEAKTLTRIGVSVGSLGNPFFVAIAAGVRSEAKRINPDATVEVVASDYDLAKQSRNIDDFIAAGDDLIVLDAVDPKAISSAIERAKAAGIVVVGVDEEADGEDATFMTDNVKAGEESCLFLADRLNGKGDVVIVNGPQVSSVLARLQGCFASLAKSPGIHVLSSNQNGQGSRDGGLDVMQSMLTRFPKIDAVFTVNDPMAIGASLAARQMHRDDFFITSVDGSPDIEAAIKDPNTKILASSYQDPYLMAVKAVRAGQDILNGKTIKPVITLIPPTLITERNVATIPGWSAPH
jgi:ribose transport system substrate-binding protein